MCEMDRQSWCNESVVPGSGASSIICASDLPEFREYASRKYPELDEDLITMIEDLIEREKERVKPGKSCSLFIANEASLNNAVLHL